MLVIIFYIFLTINVNTIKRLSFLIRKAEFGTALLIVVLNLIINFILTFLFMNILSRF
jgi:hypothetical protein